MERNKIVENVKNNIKQEKILEDLKNWYRQNKLNSYYIDVEEIYPDGVKMYKITNYCNLEDTVYNKSKAKNTKLECEAFDYFITLCEKYDQFIENKWISTMIFNESFNSMLKYDFLDDFCKIEKEKIMKDYEVVDITNNGTIVIVFDNIDKFQEYSEKYKTAEMERIIENDLKTYLKENNLEDTDLKITFNYNIK